MTFREYGRWSDAPAVDVGAELMEALRWVWKHATATKRSGFNRKEWRWELHEIDRRALMLARNEDGFIWWVLEREDDKLLGIRVETFFSGSTRASQLVHVARHAGMLTTVYPGPELQSREVEGSEPTPEGGR